MAFQNNTPERIVLGDEAGAHIVLDSGLNAIQLWDGDTIVGELRAPENPFDLAFRIAVPGDTDARFLVRGDGGLFWGPGNFGPDVNLYRDTADVNTLKTDGSLHIATNLLVDAQALIQQLITPAGGINLYDGETQYESTAQPRYMQSGQPLRIAATGLAFPNTAAAQTYTDIGCEWDLDVTQLNASVEVGVNVQCRNTNFGAGIAFESQLLVDGVAQSRTLVSQPSASNTRAMVNDTFVFDPGLLTPGTHNFKVQSRLTGTPPTGYSVEADRSHMLIKLWE